MLSSFATVDMNAPTKQRMVVPPEVPHDTRISIADLVDATHRTEENPQNQSLEENTLYPSFDHCARSSAATWDSQASKSETRLGSCSVSNVAFNETARCPVTRPSLEEAMSSTPSSAEHAEETTFHAQSSSVLSSQWWMRCTSATYLQVFHPEQLNSGKRIPRTFSNADTTPSTM